MVDVTPLSSGETGKYELLVGITTSDFLETASFLFSYCFSCAVPDCYGDVNHELFDNRPRVEGQQQDVSIWCWGALQAVVLAQMPQQKRIHYSGMWVMLVTLYAAVFMQSKGVYQNGRNALIAVGVLIYVTSYVSSLWVFHRNIIKCMQDELAPKMHQKCDWTMGKLRTSFWKGRIIVPLTKDSNDIIPSRPQLEKQHDCPPPHGNVIIPLTGFCLAAWHGGSPHLEKLSQEPLDYWVLGGTLLHLYEMTNLRRLIKSNTGGSWLVYILAILALSVLGHPGNILPEVYVAVLICIGIVGLIVFHCHVHYCRKRSEMLQSFSFDHRVQEEIRVRSGRDVALVERPSSACGLYSGWSLCFQAPPASSAGIL